MKLKVKNPINLNPIRILQETGNLLIDAARKYINPTSLFQVKEYYYNII